VFSADVLAALGFSLSSATQQIGGVGGLVDSLVVPTQVRLAYEGGGRAAFHGQYAAVTALAALDMSVLGRDITNLFAVIVDRGGDFVGLLGQRHSYRIEEK
jgi:hypothetical protein